MRSNLAASIESSPVTDRSLRISVVTETYPPEVNGVAMTMEHMVKGLLARGHRVQLIRPRQFPNETDSHQGNLQIVPQPGFTLPFYRAVKVGFPASRALQRCWRADPPDVVHVATEGPLGRSALSSAKRLHLPASSSFHTNFHSYSRHYGFGMLAKPIIGYLRRFHNRTSCTLVATEELAKQLRELGFRRTRILSRGVDTRLFKPTQRSDALRRTWGVADDDPVLLYVGRLAAEKNLDLVIRAFQAIHTRVPRARLVLVGDGPLREALASRCPQAIFRGMRLGEELATHYASADIFLFPSLTETFGNVTLEAMASGLAVVAFDYAAARQHLEQGHSGLLAPVADAAAFIAAACDLVAAPKRWSRMGEAARLAVEPFDWEHIYRDFEIILLELIAQGDEHV
ncbi:MAG: glycosyltransferase family 1 protein [Gammaproteobacteria bacterium]|nr:glycosyltransferase family 1 protein [Gammaproteobacteria bacterium]MCP5425436.1 glycosyltransferase family 1 protein [Gammaproteobacteria bacterium]MCP5459785.1 glycosyltransferase family 1 protein [Gammaproteobacteria bacterium]